jgi:hypothetical protein
MTRQDPPLQSPDYLRQGSVQNATREESMSRLVGGANNAIGATGVAHATAMPLQAGEVVSSVSFVTATTAAGTPTAGFVALYSADAIPVLLAQSADFEDTARAANTAFTVPLTESVTITEAGLYWVSIAFAASTVPTLRGAALGSAALAGAVVSGFPVAAQSHGSSLTGTAPATITSGTAVATPVYYVLT